MCKSVSWWQALPCITKPDDRDGGKSFSDRFLKGSQYAYQGTCAREAENTKTYWFPKSHLNLGLFLEKLKKVFENLNFVLIFLLKV